MSKKSVVSEAQEIQLAIELINLGARLQLLESEVSLSRERLLKLYKELKGVSPPKGMLPFSTDWFLTWQPNIHSSLFINIHTFLVTHAGATGIQAVIPAVPGTNAARAGRRAGAVADPRLDAGALL
jgi:flagellar transcriptional activator FlhC